MKLKHFLIPYTKISSKWTKYLNVTPETTKLLEENIGRTLGGINQSKILYDPPPRVMEIKTKVNKYELLVYLEINPLSVVSFALFSPIMGIVFSPSL